MVYKIFLRNIETGRFSINPSVLSQSSKNYKKDIRNNNQQTGNHFQAPGRNIKTGLRMRVKPGKPKKFHELCFKTREGPEDWQSRNALQSGKSEGSEK